MTGNLSTKNEAASLKLDSRKQKLWRFGMLKLLHFFLSLRQPESVGMNCSFGRGLLSESKRRAAILRTVFRLLDHKDTQLLLKVARIIIAVNTL